MTKATILRVILSLAVVIAFAACDSDSKSAKPKREEVKPPPPVTAPKPLPPPEPKKEKEPEPTTPEEIATARKTAMLEGRDKDAIKYCEMEGLEAGKSDPQALLGCAIAACRDKQVDKAREWSKALPKPLMKQAKQICAANHVGL